MAFYKYPRTFHFPWSESITSDDVWHVDDAIFIDREVIFTEKLDGECTSMYRDHVHARSIDSKHHPSRSIVKGIHAQIRHLIPENYRICGENIYAWHSIFYTDLPSYFMVFGIYDDNNNCLSWDETVEWCDLLGLKTVPVLYRGKWDKDLIDSIWDGTGTYPTYEATDPDIRDPKFPQDFKACTAEGYVVRVVNSFPYSEHSVHTSKHVRANHVKTSSNWMLRKPFPNLLVNS